MKKFIIAGIAALLAVTCWYYLLHPLGVKLQIGNNRFFVETAVTPAEKEKGLGYRDSMPENHGMLFAYDHADQYSYWMKGMRFPLDIIWIKDKTIVDISKNVPVADGAVLPTYSPKTPADKVFEINAGLSDKLGIKIGDTIQTHF